MNDLYVCREYSSMFTEGYKVIETLEKHDAKIRADVIDEFVEELRSLISDLRTSIKNNSNAFIDLDCIARKLKNNNLVD